MRLSPAPVPRSVLANLGMKLYGGSYIGEGGRLRPYAVLGAGYFSQNPNFSGGEKTEDTTINAGLGVRWMITSRFGASLDGRTVYNVDKSNNDTIAYLGLNYYLGNVTPPPSLCRKPVPMKMATAYVMTSMPALAPLPAPA